MTTKVDPGPEAGERIGAYRVVRRLATGGTSDVLLAKAEGPHGFERTVVLKVLLSHFGKDDDVARMFAREAAAYARLSHPAIVRLFDFFSVPADGNKGGQLVMVLEYVDGPPLARLKSMVKAIGKELDDKASIYVATCIFSALAAAHSAADDQQLPAPVVHRDVNPSNVLVPWDGYPKLADFGIAKVTGVGHQSVVGMIKGTYGYMAPEQVTGQDAVTPRSDVYAASIILWELLTRRRAFQRGALPEIEALRAMAEPRLPALESIRSDVDRSVRDALRRALEPRVDKRKITAEEMVSVLTSVVPIDVGRERLLSLLGLVRNDARAANAQASIAPPAMGAMGGAPLPEITIPIAPKAPGLPTATMHGVAPPPTVQGIGLSRLMPKGAPRPSSQRMLAAPPAKPLTPGEMPAVRPSSERLPAALPAPANPPYGGLPALRPSSERMAAAAPMFPSTFTEPSVRDLLSLPTRPAMPAVTPSAQGGGPPLVGPPLVGPPPQPNRVASRPGMPVARPLSSPPPATSAAARLRDSIPPVEAALESVPPTRPHAMMDLGDAFPTGRLSAPPDSPKMGAPLKDLTGGLGLRDAIDEIMKGVPASASMAAGRAVNQRPAEDTGEHTAVLRETTRVPPNVAREMVQAFTEGRDIGQIPPAPAPMQSFPPAEYPNAGDPSDEPVDTVVLEPAPHTPRMHPSGFASTVAMQERPAPGPPPSEPRDPKSTTGAMPKYTPPPFAATPVPVSPPSRNTTPPVASQNPPALARPPMMVAAGPPSARDEKRGLGVGTIAILLVLIVAAGVAGTVAFVRYQATKDGTDVVSPPPPPPTVTVATPPPSAPASVATPAPAVDAAAAPPAVSATAAPAADSDAATPGEAVAVPEGMGLIKTAGTAPGRRIFVDDKVAGQTPESVTLKCGPHVVKLGSTGKAQEITVPCGGEIPVGDVK